MHEFGHAFAALADEYDYADGATYSGPEPDQPNVSTYTAATQAAQQLKWYRWLDLAHVNTFLGAMYNEFGIYRPTFNSKMRSLDRPFEEINVEQFVLTIYEYVSPIDDATPPSTEPASPYQTFYVTVLQPLDHDLDIQWFVDAVEVPGATLATFTPSSVPLSPGIHNVSVTVVDSTSRVRDEVVRNASMTETRQWQVFVVGPAGLDLISLNGGGTVSTSAGGVGAVAGVPLYSLIASTALQGGVGIVASGDYTMRA